MYFIIPALILAMFGVWVFNLKQEINDLQDEIHRREPHSARPMPTSVSSVKVPQRNDVQTWVLE